MKHRSRIDYTPRDIAKMSESQIRKAYSDLRSIANKRIQRLEKAGLNFEERPKFATIQQIRESSKWNVASQLATVSKYLRADTTVTKARLKVDEFKKTMHEYGFDFLADSNDDAIKGMKYLDSLREIYSDKIFDSGDALDVLEQTERLKIPVEKVIDNYEKFHDNLKNLESMEPKSNGREFTSKQIDKLIKSWK